MRGNLVAAALCAIVFTVVALYVLVLADRVDPVDCDGKPDWSVWRSSPKPGSEAGEDRRRAAASRIVHCRSLHGRSRRDVRRVLGEEYESSRAVRGDHSFLDYYLGPDGLGIDDEFMSIELDGRARVVRVHVP